MRVHTYARGGVRVVVIEGDLDAATAAEADGGLGGLVPVDGPVLFDLGRVSYLSSTGLRVLLLMFHRARGRGVPLALADVPREARAVLAATGLLEAVVVADSVDEGIRALTPRAA
jgi:anti-sigma B factor antagonist